MTTVTLHGELAQVLGRAEWQFEVSRPAEIFRALEANTGKLISHMFASPESEYRMLIDEGDMLVTEELIATRPMSHIHIMPVMAGAGNSGGWLAIIGLVIIAAVVTLATAGAGTAAGGLLLTGSESILAGGTLSTLGAFAITLGVTLTLTGISQMLVKSPESNQKENAANTPGYVFNGAINSYRQGNPVPVGFGRARIGSQVISAGIRSIDMLAPVT